MENMENVSVKGEMIGGMTGEMMGEDIKVDIGTDIGENIDSHSDKQKYVIAKHKFKGVKNKFNQYLYEKYDLPAREIIKSRLKDFVKDNEDIYGQDLVITDPNCRYKYLELQVCTYWTSEKFPFPKIYVYERKHRYDNDTLFLTLNKYMDKGYVFDAECFKNAVPRRIKKYSREFVYDIPWNNAMFVPVNHLEPEDILMY